jgi:hypothetical protein
MISPKSKIDPLPIDPVPIGLGRMDAYREDPVPVPPKLENTFNRMYLLTTNLLPDNVRPVVGAGRGQLNLTGQEAEEAAKKAIDTYIANLIGNEPHISQIEILKKAYKQRLDSYSSYNNSSTARRRCIEYDLKSLNGDPVGLDDDANISAIATKFYEFVLRVHCYNLYCILVLLKQLATNRDKASGILPQTPIGGVLFMNPLFNGYDATFHGPDGVHDAEPRGDMMGADIKQKRKDGGPPKGGWKVIEKLIKMGNKQREDLLLAIRTSSFMPTNDQSDDISKAIGRSWKSLTADKGHQLLEPTDFERLICNIVMPEKVVLSSSDFLPHSGNRYKIVQVKDSTDGVEKTRENARKVYGFGSLNNNFAVSDCSGPTPSELHSLVGSANIVPGVDDVEEEVGNGDEDGDDDDDEEQGGGGPKKKAPPKAPAPKAQAAKAQAPKAQAAKAQAPKVKKVKKSKSEKKEEKRGRVGTVTSGILDSSTDKSPVLFEKLKKIIPSTDDFKDYATFLMPHTRWPFEVKSGPAAGQILCILQRIIINFSKTTPIYQLRFEAWCTEALPGVNASQTVPTKFLSASKFFELKNKSPGVNETIRYILAYVTGTGVKDLEKKYAEQMYSEKVEIEKFNTKAKKSKLFFDNFSNAFDEVFEGFSKIKVGSTDTKYGQIIGNLTLLKMAVLFRQKTMGDNVRLADAAYLNEELWYAQNKTGIAVEGTCDGFSGFKAMAANNNPVILCGANKWGSNYKMYSSFTLDPADAARAALQQKTVMYVEKTQKLKTTLERLRIDFYKLKTFKLDQIAATVFVYMQQIFIENGEEYLERVVVDEIDELNTFIIKQKTNLAALSTQDRDSRPGRYLNSNIDNSNIAIREITQVVEASLSIIGLALLMNTFVQNWFAYCEQFLDIWTTQIDDFIAEIDEGRLDDGGVDNNNPEVNKCISLIPSTEEMDRIKAFYDVCDTTMPNWSEPKTLEELTNGLLTLTVKKDFSLPETKLKKLFDKGLPSLLCQEKGTTVSYASLTKYRDALVSLENMFVSLNPGIIPGPIGPLPQIDMVFSSGILNRIAEEQMILWVKQNGYIQIQLPPGDAEEEEEKKLDAVLKPPPTLEEQAAEEEEEEPTPQEIKIKPTPKTSTLNKVFSAVRAVTSLRFLRSRKSSVVPEKGGGIQRGGNRFQDILSEVETLASKQTDTQDIYVKGYLPKDLSLYLPTLFSIDFKEVTADSVEATSSEMEEDQEGEQQEEPSAHEKTGKMEEDQDQDQQKEPSAHETSREMEGVEVEGSGEEKHDEEKILTPKEFKDAFNELQAEESTEMEHGDKEPEVQPEGWESFVDPEVPNEVLTSCIGDIQDSLDSLLVAMDSAGELQVLSEKEEAEMDSGEQVENPNPMINSINELNEGLVSEGIRAINEYLNALKPEEDSYLKQNIEHLEGFLNGSLVNDDKSSNTSMEQDESDTAESDGSFGVGSLFESKQMEVDKVEETNDKNSKYALVGVMLKFKSEQGVNLDDKNALSLCDTFDRFSLKKQLDESILEEALPFHEAIQLKVEILFSTLIGEGYTLFGKLFKDKIMDLFFKTSAEYGDDILRNRVIEFVVQDSYGIDIDATLMNEDKGYRNILELLSICALLYNDDLLRSAVAELYFYDAGTAIQFLPAIKSGAPTPTREVEASQQEVEPDETRAESIKQFYKDYYDDIELDELKPENFPIPVKENTLPYLLLMRCKDGESTPLVTQANVKESFQFAAVCEESVLRPLVEYFWRDCCSDAVKVSIRDSVKFTLIMRGRNINEKNILDMLSSNLYCYLFGTCKTATAHNGIIMDDVPGAIIELGLHQYTRPANPYLSYSVAELQSIIQQFMSLPEYKTLIEPVNSARESLNKKLEQQQQLELELEQLQLEDEMNPDERRNGIIRDLATIQRTISQLRKQIDGDKKTRNGWIEWANSIHQGNRVAVQLPGRPEDTTIDLMTTFMNNVVGGVVANYKYFSKRQREELGIDGLAKSKDDEDGEEEGRELTTDEEKESVRKVIREKPRTLVEFYNIVLYLVALENIENINVAKVSLLSEKLGSYLSEPQELFDDINSGLELNEPSVSFYRFFMSLFLTLPKEKVAEVAAVASSEVEMDSGDEAGKVSAEEKEEIEKGFTDKRKQALVAIINGLIVDYYANRDIKRELQRMVRDNQEVMSVIEGIIKDEEKEKEEGEVVESNTLFQMTIDDSNRDKYVKFLRSLLPPKLESLPPPPTSPSPSPGSSPRFPPGGPPDGPPSDSDDDGDDKPAATTPRGPKRNSSGEPKPPADSAPLPLPSPPTTPRESGDEEEEEKKKKEGEDKKKVKRKFQGDEPGIKRPHKEDDDNDDGPPQGDGLAGLPIKQNGKKRYTKTLAEGEGDAKKPKPSEIVSDSSEKKRSSLEGSEASESKKGRIEEEGNEIPRSLKKGRAEGAAAEEGEREVVTTAKIQKRDDDEDKSKGNKIVYDNGEVRKKRNPGGGSSKRTRKHKKR